MKTLLLCGAVVAGEADRDGDSLTDFMEVHKYGTDPDRRDSDGDGKPDGDWDERREWTYTVRSVLRLLPPLTEEALHDDQQDARVVRRTKQFVELEVVHYPFNSAGRAIEADPAWRATVASRRDLAPFLAPGRCANFDAAMAKALRTGLAQRGVDRDQADDATLVRAAARWLLDETRFQDGFTTFCFDLSGAKPRIVPGLERRVQQELEKCGTKLDEQLERELFARGMFERRVRGSCTSSAILWTGCLRALGIPTRGVLHVPLLDASDEEEMGWLANLRHHRVRRIVAQALTPLRQSWSSHTMVEVFVGGRWRLLNYDRLGQPSLDANCFGLMTHVATFADWSDADAGRTIGARQHAERDAKDPFGHLNPYSCLELDDRFGEHATIDNPALPEHRTLTIERICWWSDPARPAGVDMRLDPPAAAGHALTHVAEVFPEEPSSQYASFFDAVDRAFVLRAPGRDDVALTAARGWWADPRGTTREFYLRLEPEAVARLAVGVPYTLHARNQVASHRWIVAPGVTLTRHDERAPFAGPGRKPEP